MTSKKYSKKSFANRLKKIARKLTKKKHTQKLRKKNKKTQHKKTQKGSGAENSKPEPIELDNVNKNDLNQEKTPVMDNENILIPENRGNNDQDSFVENMEEKYDDNINTVEEEQSDIFQSNEDLESIQNDKENEPIESEEFNNTENSEIDEVMNKNEDTEIESIDNNPEIPEVSIDTNKNKIVPDEDSEFVGDSNGDTDNNEEESIEKPVDNWNYEKVKEVLEMLDSVVTKLNKPFENYKSSKNSVFLMTEKNSDQNLDDEESKPVESIEHIEDEEGKPVESIENFEDEEENNSDNKQQ